MYGLSCFVPQANDASTVRRELPAESLCRVPKQLSACELQAKLAAANVRKADFLEPSVFAQTQPRHAHGIYSSINSIARKQQLESTNNGDKRWMMASSSGTINAGPAPVTYGRLTSRSDLPAPPLRAIFKEPTARRCGPAITRAAIQTAPTVYGDRLRWADVKVARSASTVWVAFAEGRFRAIMDNGWQQQFRNCPPGEMRFPISQNVYSVFCVAMFASTLTLQTAENYEHLTLVLSFTLSGDFACQVQYVVVIMVFPCCLSCTVLMVHVFAALSDISSGHGVGRGNASAEYGMSKSRFEVADEDSYGMSTSRCHRSGVPSQAWRVCKPGCASRMTADTDAADGILDFLSGADIFGVL